MKVISIKEPYGTCIIKHHKLVETRSWKTTYRGEIYIHTSKSLMKDPITNSAYKYISKDELQYEMIIGKANLVDCIEMTEDYVKMVKEKNPKEYSLGIYEVGRYAWVLENVEEIKPIPAKGKLNIWDYEEE